MQRPGRFFAWSLAVYALTAMFGETTKDADDRPCCRWRRRVADYSQLHGGARGSRVSSPQVAVDIGLPAARIRGWCSVMLGLALFAIGPPAAVGDPWRLWDILPDHELCCAWSGRPSLSAAGHGNWSRSSGEAQPALSMGSGITHPRQQ